MERRTLIVIAVGIAAAGALAVGLMGGEEATDEDRIRALFSDAALAVEEKRVGDAVEALSERFSGEGLDRQGVKRLIAGLVLRGDWVQVSIAGVAVGVEGDGARATVDVVMARGGKGKALTDLLPEEGSAHRIPCVLAREDGEWRVVSAGWAPITLAEALAGPPAP
jgi:hypothetical protein